MSVARGNRVQAAVRPWVAAADAAYGHPQALEGAMGFDGFDGIGRTAGGEAALPADPGAQEETVEPDRCNQEFLEHGTARWKCASASARTCRLSSLSETAGALLCRRTTKSRGGSCWRRCRNASRTTRLMALRVTARAAWRLGTTRPSLPWPADESTDVRTSKAPRATRLPLSAGANSSGLCSLAEGGKLAESSAANRAGAAWAAAQSAPRGAPAMPACVTLDGEALAAARTACIDDSAASTRLHADTEAVGALAAGNGRLEGAFHGRNLKRAAAGLKENTHGNRQSGKWNSEKPTISAKNALGVNGLVAFRLGAVVRVMRCPAADTCCVRGFALSPGRRTGCGGPGGQAVRTQLLIY